MRFVYFNDNKKTAEAHPFLNVLPHFHPKGAILRIFASLSHSVSPKDKSPFLWFFKPSILRFSPISSLCRDVFQPAPIVMRAVYDFYPKTLFAFPGTMLAEDIELSFAVLIGNPKVPFLLPPLGLAHSS